MQMWHVDIVFTHFRSGLKCHGPCPFTHARTSQRWSECVQIDEEWEVDKVISVVRTDNNETHRRYQHNRRDKNQGTFFFLSPRRDSSFLALAAEVKPTTLLCCWCCGCTTGEARETHARTHDARTASPPRSCTRGRDRGEEEEEKGGCGSLWEGKRRPSRCKHASSCD